MQDETLSPDGCTRVEWSINTGRMSHEICSPRISDAHSGEMILDLWAESSWDASIQWLDHGIMRLRIRHYLEGGSTILDVDVDRAAGFFSIDGGAPLPIATLQREVPEAFWRKAGRRNR